MDVAAGLSGRQGALQHLGDALTGTMLRLDSSLHLLGPNPSSSASLFCSPAGPRSLPSLLQVLGSGGDLSQRQPRALGAAGLERFAWCDAARRWAASRLASSPGLSAFLLT